MASLALRLERLNAALYSLVVAHRAKLLLTLFTTQQELLPKGVFSSHQHLVGNPVHTCEIHALLCYLESPQQ